MSSNIQILIYPTDVDDACRIIGEAIIEFNGEFIERKILGMVQCQAVFLNEDDTEAALEYLESLEAVSHVSRA